MMRVLLLLVLSAAALAAQAPQSSTAIGEWPTYGGDLAEHEVLAARSDQRANFGIVEGRMAREIAGRAPEHDAARRRRVVRPIRS